MPEFVRNGRFWLVMLAWVSLLVALLRPHWPVERARPEVLFVLDITGSMNVRDYDYAGQPRSRLEHAKHTIDQTLARLPCGSRAGLAVFSERRSFLLLEPVEVCENYGAVAATLSRLDWRMAWEGDSHIATGVFNGIELAESVGASVIFITDGHEAPPLPSFGGPSFEGDPAQVTGLLVGAGGDQLVPIPKFDDMGNEIGFYEVHDVDQENRLGMPPPDAQQREGWHPRNAPFGAAVAEGNEHLSSVRREYLSSLAQATGLHYIDLRDADSMISAIQRASRQETVITPLDLRPLLGLAAVVLLLLYYLSAFWRGRRPRSAQG